MKKSFWLRSARCSKMHAKTCAQRLPKPSPARPQTLENRSPGRPREPKFSCEAARTSRETPKSAHQLPKRHPKSVQERSRAAPELPKAGEVAPKRNPRGGRTPPKSSPTNPKMRFEQEFCGKLCSRGAGTDFMSFFGLRGKLAIC